MPRTKGKLTYEQMVELYHTHSVNQIAKLDGTSYVAVLRLLHRLGVKMRSRGNNALRVAPVKHGYCQLARQCKMTPYRYVRLAAIVVLGGACVGCGETDLQVLDINHVNGRDAVRSTSAKYRQFCSILAGNHRLAVEVTCCNCNRRHEVVRGNIPGITKEFLCLHKSQLKSFASDIPSSTRKKLRDGCVTSVPRSSRSRRKKR